MHITIIPATQETDAGGPQAEGQPKKLSETWTQSLKTQRRNKTCSLVDRELA